HSCCPAFTPAQTGRLMPTTKSRSTICTDNMPDNHLLTEGGCLFLPDHQTRAHLRSGPRRNPDHKQTRTPPSCIQYLHFTVVKFMSNQFPLSIVDTDHYRIGFYNQIDHAPFNHRVGKIRDIVIPCEPHFFNVTEHGLAVRSLQSYTVAVSSRHRVGIVKLVRHFANRCMRLNYLKSVG